MECEPIVIKPHPCSQSVSPTAQHINQIQHMTAGAQRAPAATATLPPTVKSGALVQHCSMIEKQDKLNICTYYANTMIPKHVP